MGKKIAAIIGFTIGVVTAYAVTCMVSEKKSIPKASVRDIEMLLEEAE